MRAAPLVIIVCIGLGCASDLTGGLPELDEPAELSMPLEAADDVRIALRAGRSWLTPADPMCAAPQTCSAFGDSPRLIVAAPFASIYFEEGVSGTIRCLAGELLDPCDQGSWIDLLQDE